MTTTMVRKQIYIPRRQDILIKRLSQTRGVSEAEIIRQAIEHEINTELAGLGVDNISAWEAILEFVEHRKAEVKPAEPYQWDRAEIYADREERWSRLEQNQ